MYSIPNILTLGRLIAIPFFVLLFYLPVTWSHAASSFVFALACITDWLDGYLARSLQQSTKLGAFLDPVADKIIICIALVIIVGESQFQFINLHARVLTIPIFVLTIPAAIIVSREIILSALREWMAELGKRTSIAVSRLGKIKTTIQMIALIILLYCDVTTKPFIVITGLSMLYIAAFLTLWSMVIYLKAAWPELQR